MKFEVYESKGKYYFRLKARNGQTILTSQGYASKSGCTNGVQSVKTNARNSSNFERKASKDGRFMFNLLSTNKQIIGTSQMYKSKASCENGIAAVQRVAPAAQSEELD
jgi:uncharacterized protein YegP (UPF0339 family)